MYWTLAARKGKVQGNLRSDIIWQRMPIKRGEHLQLCLLPLERLRKEWKIERNNLKSPFCFIQQTNIWMRFGGSVIQSLHFTAFFSQLYRPHKLKLCLCCLLYLIFEVNNQWIIVSLLVANDCGWLNQQPSSRSSFCAIRLNETLIFLKFTKKVSTPTLSL